MSTTDLRAVRSTKRGKSHRLKPYGFIGSLVCGRTVAKWPGVEFPTLQSVAEEDLCLTCWPDVARRTH